ncbi:MAG: dihydropteroate synthase [Actinobacteria bacterium RBG_19FT_COMBO_70_19]|nr:MAG: dihydropteroate synthase [Actinobacteria bacterium RBG_19FT_COMBO_70_19]
MADELHWHAGGRVLDCAERTLVMGVVNVTPDSFSDGGRYLDADAAVTHALGLVEDGADIVDIGGESTRPHADPVTSEEERERVLPVIEHLAAAHPGLAISIDTRKPEVAAAALAAGACIVNDVSGGRSEGMFDVVREADAGMVLMHMLGEPKTMQEAPHYDDVVAEVKEYLRGRIEAAEWAGIRPQALAIDPGIGFGKNLEHNLALIRHLDALADLGRPILVGPSRKRFIGAILDLPEGERVEGTAGAVAWLVGRGAHIVRVHDVRQIVRVVRVVDAIVRAEA